MIIYHILDEVFRNGSRVAVLRSLLDTNSGYTGNKVARLSGMHPLSALKALTVLEQLGIVHRQRGGRDHIFTLNRSHYLVQYVIIPIYKAEQELLKEITRTIAALLKRSVLNATIFGSIAKRTETAMSDFDLCCVVKTESQKELVRNLLNSNSRKLHQTFGIKVAPMLFTLREMKAKSKTLLIRDIAAHGLDIVGKELKVLLHD
ncbi:MAG: nucleotidyltransferase domain-containing protein [Bacteroidota bacterium]